MSDAVLAAPPISVAVVDDQPMFASGMGMLVESQPDLRFAGSATDGHSGAEFVRRVRPDIVLMDIRMPVLDGIAATERIVATGSASRIIVLTTFQRDEAVFRAVRAGASGFLTKDATPEFVLAAIRTVHSGKAVLAPTATLDLVQRFARPPRRALGDRPVEAAIEALTPREQEIFLLVARGLSNTEVATAAFVSEATAKTHLRSILAKLDLRGRVQVVIYAYENGLLDR
jgi:DNA-binding NarL/FixJ family response regulator